MYDTDFGVRDRLGHWRPHKRVKFPAVFVWPPQPFAFAKFLFAWPGYIWPWNFLNVGIGVAIWAFLTPSLDTLKSLSFGWVCYLLARNLAITALYYGIFHIHLYWEKRQGTNFKYNSRWPSSKNSAFLFGNQHIDNVVWSLGSGVPIWTVFEVATLWLTANNYLPTVTFVDHPIYFAALFLIVPLWQGFHFYFIHRLIHFPILYRVAHKVHHQNVNPGPWSGISMHPIEHVLYFSAVMLFWIVPSSPAHALGILTLAALGPAKGHTGFEKIVLKDGVAVDTNGWRHYLHHKFFECNYGDGVIPLDQWFGTLHDGSEEAEVLMNKRFKEAMKQD